MMQDLNRLKVFVAVARAGSFSAAAKRLSMTPSGVSRAISRLEDELDVRLVQRSTRHLSLTSDGQVFFSHCANMLEELEQAQQALTAGVVTPRGTLRVSMPTALGQIAIAPALPRFLKAHPELRLEVSLSNRRVDLTEEGFDAAVRFSPMHDQHLIARRLASVRFVMAAAPHYVAQRGLPQNIGDLAGHDTLGFLSPRSGTAAVWPIRGPRGAVTEWRPTAQLIVDDSRVLIDAALGGLGIVCLHRYLLSKHLRAGALQTVLDGHEPDNDELFVVYPHRRHLAARTRAFLDFMSAWVSDAEL